MKAEVIPSYRNSIDYTVRIVQGVQSFTLDYSATYDEAKWLAEMFEMALQKHDREKGAI